MKIKVPVFRDLRNNSSVSEDLKSYNCEISVPERDGVFWCVLLASLLQIHDDKTKREEFLLKATGKKRVNVVKVGKRILSFNPFSDRHAYFCDDELKKTNNSFVDNAFEYRAKYIDARTFDDRSDFDSFGSKTELWLDILANMLDCKITFVLDTTKVSTFPKYLVNKERSSEQCLSLLVFGSTTESMCKAVSFGLSRPQAEVFQKLACEKTLAEESKIKLNTSSDSVETKQNLILYLMKSNDHDSLDKLMKMSSYELDKLNEAGYSTDVANTSDKYASVLKSNKTNPQSAYLYAAENGRRDWLYMLYDYSLTKASYSASNSEYYISVKNIMLNTSDELYEAIKICERKSNMMSAIGLLQELYEFNKFHLEILENKVEVEKLKLQSTFTKSPTVDEPHGTTRTVKATLIQEIFPHRLENYFSIRFDSLKKQHEICRIPNLISCLSVSDFYFKNLDSEQLTVENIMLRFIRVCLWYYEENVNVKILHLEWKNLYTEFLHFFTGSTGKKFESLFSKVIDDIFSLLRLKYYFNVIGNLDVENNFQEAYLVMRRLIQVMSSLIGKAFGENVSQILECFSKEAVEDLILVRDMLCTVNSGYTHVRMLISKDKELFQILLSELKKISKLLNNVFRSSSMMIQRYLYSAAEKSDTVSDISNSEASNVKSFSDDDSMTGESDTDSGILVHDAANRKLGFEERSVRASPAPTQSWLPHKKTHSKHKWPKQRGQERNRMYKESQVRPRPNYSTTSGLKPDYDLPVAQGGLQALPSKFFLAKLPQLNSLYQGKDEKFQFSDEFKEKLKEMKAHINESSRERTFEFFLEDVRTLKDLLIGTNTQFKRLWNDVKTKSARGYVRRQLVRIYADQKSLQACIEFLLSDCYAIMKNSSERDSEIPNILDRLRVLMETLDSPLNSMNLKNFFFYENPLMKSVGKIIAPYGLPNDIVNIAMDLVADIEVLEAIYKMKVEVSSDYKELMECIKTDDDNEDFAKLCRLIKKSRDWEHYLNIIPSAKKYSREKLVSAF